MTPELTLAKLFLMKECSPVKNSSTRIWKTRSEVNTDQPVVLDTLLVIVGVQDGRQVSHPALVYRPAMQNGEAIEAVTPCRVAQLVHPISHSVQRSGNPRRQSPWKVLSVCLPLENIHYEVNKIKLILNQFFSLTTQ